MEKASSEIAVLKEFGNTIMESDNRKQLETDDDLKVPSLNKRYLCIKLV